MKRRVMVVAAAVVLAGVGAAFGQSTNSFSGLLFANSNWEYKKTTGSSTLLQTFENFVQWQVANGTNAYQMSAIAVASGTLAGSATNTVSLGAMADGFGDVRSFARVRFMAVQTASNNVDSVRFGGAAVDPFASWAGDASDTVNVAPGGLVMFVAPQAAGYAVGTSTNMMIVNTGTNSATYYLYVAGHE